MKKSTIPLLISILFTATFATVQQKVYMPRIESCDCRFQVDPGFIKTAPANLRPGFEQPFARIDSSFKTRCGYLVVPGNRAKQTSRMIKLPFKVDWSDL